MNAALNHELNHEPRGAIPCPADLWHDSACIADRDGCELVEALDGAAISAGYASHSEAAAFVLGLWRHSIRTAQPQTPRGRDAVRDALQLLRDVGGDLCAHGWAAGDLFGFDPQGERHGLAFRLRGGLVETVGHDTISYRAGAVGRLGIFNRMSTAGDLSPFWELSK